MFTAEFVTETIATAETKTLCIRKARKYCTEAIKDGFYQISTFNLFENGQYLETHTCDNSGNHWKVNFNAYRPN